MTIKYTFDRLQAAVEERDRLIGSGATCSEIRSYNKSTKHTFSVL
jgi:hypothetical protein